MPDTPGLGCDINEEFIARYPSQGNVSEPVPTDADKAGGHGRLYVQTRLQRNKLFNPGGGQ